MATSELGQSAAAPEMPGGHGLAAGSELRHSLCFRLAGTDLQEVAEIAVMESFHGQLLRKGKVLLENVEGQLHIAPGPKGEEHWSGFCSLPGSVRIGLTDLLELILPDRRRSTIRIDRVNTFGPTLTVSFISWHS